MQHILNVKFKKNYISLQPLARHGAHLHGVGEVGDRGLVVPGGGDKVEICLGGGDGHFLHRLDVGPPSFLIFLWLNEFVPLELVIREKGLVVADRYRLGVPCQVLEGPELVYTTEVRVNRQAAACEGHVLGDRQAEAILEVVGVCVTEGSVLITLQQGQGTVEVHQVAVKVERGKPAGLVAPVRPVGRDEGVFRLQGSHRLRPCRADRLLKCHRALG